MKKQVKNSLIIFACLMFGLISCETVVDLDIPIQKPMVVVNSTLSANEFPKVRLTYSRHVLDNAHGYNFISDAEVKLIVGKEIIPLTFNEETMEYINLDYMVKSGTTYELKINVPDYSEVNAIDRVPEVISIDTLQFNGLVQRDQWSEEAEFELVFTDPLGENYYEISGFTVGRYEYMDQTGTIREEINTQPLYIEPKNPSFQSGNNYERSVLFSDRLFEGSQVVFDFYTNLRTWNNSEILETYFVLKSISKNYYDYQTTSTLQYSNFGDPFAQPVQVFNNIENGIGIFRSESSNIFHVDSEN